MAQNVGQGAQGASHHAIDLHPPVAGSTEGHQVFQVIGFQVMLVLVANVAKGTEGLDVVYVVGAVGALRRAAMPAAVSISRPRPIPLLLPVGPPVATGHVEQPFLFQARRQFWHDVEPIGGGLHLLFGDALWRDFAPADDLVGVQSYLLERRDFGSDQHLAVGFEGCRGLGLLRYPGYLGRNRRTGLGIVPCLDRFYLGAASLPIQLSHQVRLAAVQVDSILVDQDGCALPVYDANDISLLRGVGDDKVVHLGGAQADSLSRVDLVGPVPLFACQSQQPLFLKEGEDLRGMRKPSERLTLGKGQLKGRAADVIHNDDQVVGIEESLLRRAPEKVVGMGYDVLVEGRGPGDQHRHRGLRPASRPSRLLPGAGDGAGIAGHNTGIQVADVDAQFQGIGGHHAQNLPLAQAPLDRAPLQWQVPPPVALHLLGTKPGAKGGVAEVL